MGFLTNFIQGRKALRNPFVKQVKAGIKDFASIYPVEMEDWVVEAVARKIALECMKAVAINFGENYALWRMKELLSDAVNDLMDAANISAKTEGRELDAGENFVALAAAVDQIESILKVIDGYATATRFAARMDTLIKQEQKAFKKPLHSETMKAILNLAE